MAGPGFRLAISTGLGPEFEAGYSGMMRFISRLFKLAFYLVAVMAAVFVLTAIWMSFDGLVDQGSHADVALVVGNAQVDTGEAWPVLQARLDRAVKLYNDSDFSAIIVSGIPKDGGYDEADAMAKYLASQGVPLKVIYQDHLANNPEGMVADIGTMMVTERFSSVMIVGHYYQITRLKLILRRHDIDNIMHEHTGNLSQADGYNIAREVYEFYDYLARYYVMPKVNDLTKNLPQQISGLLGNAKQDAEKAKESVDKKLDNLSK